MFDLPASYDTWKTTPPDPEYLPTCCDTCDESFDAREEYIDGDECPNCDGTLLVYEPEEPCRCTGDACYC
jgi:hypothetical protein